MNDAVDAHFDVLAQGRAMKHRLACGDEYAIINRAPNNVGLGANQAMPTNLEFVIIRAPNNGVLHHDAVFADCDWPAFRNDTGPEQNSAALRDVYISAYHRIGCYVGARVNRRIFLVMRQNHEFVIITTLWVQLGSWYQMFGFSVGLPTVCHAASMLRSMHLRRAPLFCSSRSAKPFQRTWPES